MGCLFVPFVFIGSFVLFVRKQLNFLFSKGSKVRGSKHSLKSQLFQSLSPKFQTCSLYLRSLKFWTRWTKFQVVQGFKVQKCLLVGHDNVLLYDKRESFFLCWVDMWSWTLNQISSGSRGSRFTLIIYFLCRSFSMLFMCQPLLFYFLNELEPLNLVFKWFKVHKFFSN